MSIAWKKISRVLVGILVMLLAGKVLVLGAIIGLLTLVSMKDPHHKEATAPDRPQSNEVYLRNRTAAPLRLTFTVPRAALSTETMW